MKKLFLIAMTLVLSLSVMAQQKIQLRSADKAECTRSDMTSLKASFSFSTIDAQDYESERGTFSWLSLANTVLGGNEGDPQIPVVNELIAVPFGANPRIEITSYSTTDYRLEDFGMHTLMPRQLPVRKNQDPDEVPFIMNEAAYQTSGLRSEPQATVTVEGTMRGIQVGTMTIEPVSYDPVNNTIRVFNDIEVTVSFDGADAQATEDMLLKTYSPAFDAVYAQLFNDRAIRDVYTDHPDLYNTPVKMLVICYSGFQGNAALNSWLQWKLQKGYYVDIFYTSETGTSASAIASFIKTKYNASVSAGNAYTYLIVIGDTGQVPQYMTKNIDSSIGDCASDLGYSSVNFSSNTSNYFPDMYYSRISVENTTHLTNYMNKVLTYEKYEFTDGGNYLNNVILVGGWDSSNNWTTKVAKPTINYATTNYFNSSNTTYGGFGSGTISATISTSSTQGWSGTNHGCYNGLNNGVCFINYTAHGDKQEWSQPEFTAAQVATLTNTGKYFFGVGNCCLTGNFNNTTTTYSPGSAIGTNACFAETMIRVPNAGAIAYVGCSPYSYWYEDFYWAVGAHSYSAGNAPSVSSSTKGVYDVMFQDQYWNSASALLYLGNLAVQQAVTSNYTTSGITDGNTRNSAHYYFQFYHAFGDGSVMPYVTKPETNTVTIPSTVTPGTASITVNAVAGSYVAVTDNSSVIYGVAEANSSGVATVNFTNAIPPTGTLYVVVTRQQYQPYFGTINVVGGTQYNITVNQPQHGTISAPAQAYATASVTLEATPDTGYCLSAWDVRDASNHSITVTNNQFTMPESNVTVTATFIPGMEVTLASVMHGTISADKAYALQGNTINLTATPASGYVFDSWIVYKTGDVNTTVTVNNNSFTMPNYPVTVSAVFSQIVTNEVTIGSGTGTTNGKYLPTNVYYKYSLTQQIYTKAEVGTAGTITAISFYYSSSNSSGDRTLDIYMAHTSSSTITSWQTQSESNKVYSGSVTFTQGWNTITLTTPFAYNGTNNLLLTVDDNTGSWVGEYSFYTYSTSANRAIYYYNDSNNPPATSSNSYTANSVKYNAQMKVTKEVPSTEGYLSVSPNSLSDFNAVNPTDPSEPQSIAVIGSNLQANLTVTAPTGFEVCATQNGTYNSTLTLTPSNGSLQANVFVRLSSNVNPGNYSGNLTLASGTTTASVSLSGTVIPGNTQFAVTVTANPAVGGNVTGAGEYNYGTSVTVTATANTGYTFTNWTMDGEEVSTEASYSFNVLGTTALVANFTLNSYTVTATPNPIEGGSVTISGNRDGDLHLYDFEDGTSQGWTVLQGSNGDSPNNWMHCMDYEDDYYSTGHGHNGTNGFMLSESYIGSSNTSVHPDNYLVSPRILLGGSITFWATNADENVGAEHFAVAVSTNGNINANDFSTVQEWTLTAKSTKTGGTRSVHDGTWYEYTVDLSNYSGWGYVAIHHFDCYDQYMLWVDDITLVEADPSSSATFSHGESCTVTATANEGYNFVNWTENGQIVSTEAAYGFVVTADHDLVANFSEVQVTTYTIDVTVNPANAGTITGAGNYAEGSTATLTAIANTGYVFVNWSDGSAENPRSFTVTDDVTLIANFAETASQSCELVEGWNWWAPNVNITLEDLEAALGSYGVSIISQDGAVVTYSSNGWGGDLTAIEVGKMYMVQTNAACTINLNGVVVNPADYPVTIYPGTNWMGFIGTEEMSLDEALSNFTPSSMDNIKTQNGAATYYEGRGWRGRISTLVPGQGFIYTSKASTPQTFNYPAE